MQSIVFNPSHFSGRSWLPRAIEAVRVQWSSRTFFTIAQSVFDLEALMAIYAAWAADCSRPSLLNVVAFVSSEEWGEAWAKPAFVDEATWNAFEAQKPVAVPGFHRLSLDDDRFIVTLVYKTLKRSSVR